MLRIRKPLGKLFHCVYHVCKILNQYDISNHIINIFIFCKVHNLLYNMILTMDLCISHLIFCTHLWDIIMN